MSPVLRLLVLILGMAAAQQPPEFPPHWGEPPSFGTMDYRPLAGGYGHGSSTLSSWITEKMAADAEAGKPSWPPAFGRPPLMQTRDLRKLPFGYGRGSGTIARWLADSAEKFHGEKAAEYEPYE